MKRRASEKLNKAFIAVFLIICLLPSAGMLVFGESAAAANEMLASAPQLTDSEGGFNRELLKDITDYIADRFAFRQELVTAWSAISARLLGTSVEEQVLLGSEGWLYFSDTLDDYMGKALSVSELESVANNLALMQEYALGQGADFIFTIAPNKNSLYPENMPDIYPQRHDSSNAAQLDDLLLSRGVNYVNLFECLDSNDVLYYKTDTHWTARGAALACDSIMRSLGRESDFYAMPFDCTKGGVHKGDLYEMLYPAGTGSENEVTYSAALAGTPQGSTKGGNAITIRTTGGEEGQLLCWRDSFGIALYPFLADRFETALFSRASAYDLTQLSEGYDTVIIELVERNIPNLIKYAPSLPAPEREVPEYALQEGTINYTRTGSGELVQITGALPAEADGFGSRVLALCSDGSCREAFVLSENGAPVFALSIGADATVTHVIYMSCGGWVCRGATQQ